MNNFSTDMSYTHCDGCKIPLLNSSLAESDLSGSSRRKIMILEYVHVNKNSRTKSKDMARSVS